VAYNQESLESFGITYILNATYNMLNKYENIIDTNGYSDNMQNTNDHTLTINGSNSPRVSSTYSHKYKYLRVPLRDSRSQSIIEHFEPCFQFIEEARCNQAKVLVHCHQGQSAAVFSHIPIMS
jgi:hypothetical protein